MKAQVMKKAWKIAKKAVAEFSGKAVYDSAVKAFQSEY